MRATTGQLYPDRDMVECMGEFGLELDLEHVQKDQNGSAGVSN